MAIVVVTTSPATLDSGISEFVTVTNTGAVDVTVARGSQSFVLRPTQGRVVYPEGAAVTASVVSGSGQVTTAAQPAQVTQAQQVTANTAAIAGLPGTYAGLSAFVKSRDRIIVGSNCYAAGGLTTAQTTAGTARVPHRIGVACADLRLAYTNSYASGSGVNWVDADGPGDYPVSASVEISGTIYRITFGGGTIGTVGPGGVLVSDPLPVEIAAGTTIYTRTYINSTSWQANKASYVSSGTGGRVTTTDLTAPGSGAVADSIAYQYAPCALLGRMTATTTPFAPIIVGDSIDNGVGATGGSAEAPGVSTVTSTYAGFWDIALAASAGWTNLAKPGDQAQKFAPLAGHFRRARMADFATHALVGYGRNDVTQSRTAAQIEADLIAIWNLWNGRGLKVVQRTITPVTTSTDSWATTGNQTSASNDSVRVAVNQWLRAGAPIVNGAAVAVGTSGALLAGQSGHPAYKVTDICPAVETGTDTGIWKAGLTLDGTHPNTAGHAAIGAFVTAASLV